MISGEQEPAAAGDGQDGLPVPQRYWSILAIGLAITMAVLDSSLANVALPTISRDFRVDPADAIWIVNAYQLAIVVSLLPFASLGEIIGYAFVYRIGLAIFVVASAACSMADTLPELIASRALQGLGGAGIMSINAALVRFTYPSRLVGRGVGINAAVVAISAAAGPSVAAAILSVGPWQWLFAINIPLGLGTLALATFVLPQTATVSRSFDFISAGLNALTFGLVIGGVDLLTRSARPLLGFGLLALGVASGVGLGLRELNRPHPLLPLDLLRIPIFALSVGTSVCSFCAQMLALVSLPFYFDGTLKRSAVEIGLLLTPWPIAVGIVGPIVGSLADRFSAAILGAAGLVVFAAGLAALATLPNGASNPDILWRMGLCGLGFGMFQAPNNRTMILSSPSNRAGAAGGMLATARLTGQTAGATVVAILFALLPARAETIALGLAACLAAGGAIASLLRLPSERRGRLR